MMGCLLGFIVFYPEIEGDGTSESKIALQFQIAVICGT
jgi:hypothetical protein